VKAFQLKKRAQAYRRVMETLECRAMVLNDPASIAHLTRRRTINGCLVLHSGGEELFVDYTRYSMVRNTTGVRVHCTTDAPLHSAIRFLAERECRRVACDPMTIPSAYVAFKPLSDRFDWIDAGREIIRLRRVKSRVEIDHLRNAAQAAARAMDSVTGRLQDGITERECAVRLGVALLEITGEPPAFDPMVAFGEHTAHPHWIPTDRRLNPGDTIIIDCGAVDNGYCSDVTKTAFWKRASARQLRRYRIICDLLDSVCDRLKPGASCASIDSWAREALEQHGLGAYFVHPLGHGVGLHVHEPPFFSMDSEDALMVDMVFALEPGIFIPGWGGIRIEEMIRLASDGPERFYQTARNDGILS